VRKDVILAHVSSFQNRALWGWIPAVNLSDIGEGEKEEEVGDADAATDAAVIKAAAAVVVSKQLPVTMMQERPA